MLTNELLDLIKNIQYRKAEGQNVEVKAAHEGCPKRLYDTLSAFSNQDGGGVIVFGLDERQQFKAVGVYDLQDLQKNVMEQCNYMEPPVRAVFTIAEVDGKSVCSAEIPGIDFAERPCYYSGRGRAKGSYVRVGDGDIPMTDYEIFSYEAYRKRIFADAREVERATVDMLDESKLQSYLVQSRAEKSAFAKVPDDMAMELLNITRNGVPTLAAVMNFSLYPQAYFPQFAITAIVVPGTEIGDCDETNARFTANKRIDGTIKNMLDEAVAFCLRNIKVKTTIDPKTGVRTDRAEYPIDAVREAILNALIHRDYSQFTEGTPIQICFFADRLEIHSPGSLYGRMTIDKLGYTRPDLRNPALALMAEELCGAENRYSGIPTIRKAMAKHNLPAPIFENRQNEFVVTLLNETHGDASVVKSPSQLVFGRAPEIAVRDNSFIYGEDDIFDDYYNFSESFNISNADDTKVAATVTRAERLTGDIAKALIEFCTEPRSRREIADFLGLDTMSYAMTRYINPLVEEGRLAMTIPDKPKSTHQKYYSV